MLRFFLIFITVITLNAQDSHNAYDVLKEISENEISNADGNISQEYIDLFLHLKTASYVDYFKRTKGSRYKDVYYLKPHTRKLINYTKSIKYKDPEKMLDIYITFLRYAKNMESNSYGLSDFSYANVLYIILHPEIKNTLEDDKIPKEIRIKLKRATKEYAPSNPIAINRVISHREELINYMLHLDDNGEIYGFSSAGKKERYFIKRYRETIKQVIKKQYKCTQDAILNDSLQEIKNCEDSIMKPLNSPSYYILISAYASLIESIIELLNLQDNVTVELYSFEKMFSMIIASQIFLDERIWIEHKKIIEEYKLLF